MSCNETGIELKFTRTTRKCRVGETVGERGMAASKIPVLSCEGACIRGEVARLAANMIAKEEAYGRGCHGELITVPDSAIAAWIRTAERVVLIDGCSLRCHGRILEQVLDAEQLVQFDALAVHKRFNDVFDIDDVPVVDRIVTARQVADAVLARLDGRPEACCSATADEGCCGS